MTTSSAADTSRTCPQCGSLIAPAMVRCRDCGTVLGLTTQDTSRQPASRSQAVVDTVQMTPVRDQATVPLKSTSAPAHADVGPVETTRKTAHKAPSAAVLPVSIPPQPRRPSSSQQFVESQIPVSRLLTGGAAVVCVLGVVWLAGSFALGSLGRAKPDTAALWVVQNGGVAHIVREGDKEPIAVVDAAQFPVEPFQLVGIDLSHQKIDESELTRLAGLESLQQLDLTATGLTDDGLARLGTLPNLKSIVLRGTAVTGAGLSQIETPNLVSISVSGSRKFGDVGMDRIKQLPKLRTLLCGGTAVSDAAIEQLGHMTTLKRISLVKTKISAGAVERLQAALPGCKIETP